MYEIETKIFLAVLNRTRRWLDLQMRKGIIDKDEIFVCMVNNKPVSFIYQSAVEKIINHRQNKEVTN